MKSFGQYDRVDLRGLTALEAAIYTLQSRSTERRYLLQSRSTALLLEGTYLVGAVCLLSQRQVPNNYTHKRLQDAQLLVRMSTTLVVLEDFPYGRHT